MKIDILTPKEIQSILNDLQESYKLFDIYVKNTKINEYLTLEENNKAKKIKIS